MGKTKYSDEYLIQVLKDFYKKNGRTPVYKDFDNKIPCGRTFSDRFGSWKIALDKAGLLEIKSSKRQPKVYSDEELLDALKNYCEEYGELSSISISIKNNFHSFATYRQRFGSMENALDLIGMKHLWGDRNKFVKKWTKEEIVDIIIKFCITNNRIPKNTDFAKDTSGNTPSIQAILNHWDSWNSVLVDIKNFLPSFSSQVDDYFYKFPIDDHFNKLSDEYMYNKFMQLYSELGRMPSIKEIDDCDYMPSYVAYIRTFGSLKDFLIKYGLCDLITKRMHGHNYTKEYLLDKIIRYRNENNKIPQKDDLDNDPTMPCMRTYEDHFGSYLVALDLLGLKDDFSTKRYTDEEMENNLRRLYKEIGRTPNYEDLDECRYTANSTTYFNRYGSLTIVFDKCNIPYDKNTKKIRGVFGRFIKKYITPKGTLCLSKSEYIITCWLENKNIEYKKEVYYKDFLEGDNTNRRIDWIVDYNGKLYYIEYFGLYANKLYKKHANKKISDCKEKGIDLIAIFPRDLKNKTMKEIFSFVA